jgi:NitT/TauT family transport system substrate-binding protein
LLVAEALLHSEGFTDVQYIKVRSLREALPTGQLALHMDCVPPAIMPIGAGPPVVTLASAPSGCWELCGTDRVRTIRELKGKTVVVNRRGGVEHAPLAMMAAYVGWAPRTDIPWGPHPHAADVQLLAAGKVDARATGPPLALALRTTQRGHGMVNRTVERPWSQDFGCMIVSTKAFVRAYPVATTRAVRALVQATDLCPLAPEGAARLVVDQPEKVSPNAQQASPLGRYAYTLQARQEMPYGRWRADNPEDTMRFDARQCHEAGMIKASPQQIIAQGTDWRVLNARKKALQE